MFQAQKFSRAIDDDDDDELREDSVLLESPLDKVEPYQLFRDTLLSKYPEKLSRNMLTCSEMQQEQPQFYSSLAGHLSPEEQNVLQAIVAKAETVAAQQAQQAQQPPNGGAN